MVESLDHAMFGEPFITIYSDAAPYSQAADGKRTSTNLSHGQLLPVTDIAWARGAGAMIQLSGSSGQRNALFSGGFNFEKLGIGGLQVEIQ